MNGLTHVSVAFFGMLGFLFGSVLIDLDHSNLTWSNIKKGFLKCEDCTAEKGIFHKPIVAYSVAMFAIMLGIGMVIHMVMDGLYG